MRDGRLGGRTLNELNSSRDTGLEVAGLNAFYGKSQVLFDIDLSIRRGEILALLGRNGAGKSSLLLAIAGVISAKSRRIRLGGVELSRQAAFRRARAGLWLSPSGGRVFPNLTVEENLGMVRAGKRSDKKWTISKVYEVFPALGERKDLPSIHLSGGERHMLTIARAMLAEPAVLMLDEPSEGLAPIVMAEAGQMVRRLSQEGLTVLLAEQNHRLALEIADTASFIEKGRIVWSDVANRASDTEVIDRYLGV